MREFPYVVVDVFTKTRFGGNQLAVITDARDLSDRQMQQIANEFNFSETTFVLPPSNPRNTARVRIFTRVQEVPFAGHPNVGTAYVLGRQPDIFGTDPAPTMRFEEVAGLVEIELIRDHDLVVGASIKAPRPLEIGRSTDPALFAECLGLDSGAVVLGTHGPTQVSVGLPFVVGELDLASLSRARPQADAFAAAAKDGHADLGGRFSIFAYARLGRGTERLRARMFAPLGGTVEDPATGSASAALGAYLAALDPRSDAGLLIGIEQGVEMGRRSEIELFVRKSRGQVEEVKITGQCVQIMRGVLEA